MNYQFKAFNLSLAMHIVLIVILTAVGNSLVLTSKMIVIDFTIGNPVKAPEPSVSSKVVTQKDKKRHPAVSREKRDVQDKKLEVPPAPRHVETTEEHMPILKHEMERIDSSVISEKMTEPVSMSAGGQAGTSTLISRADADKESYGLGSSGDSLEQEKARYLKKNFAYIKYRVQRHIIYPTFARKMGWKGQVTISFIVTRIGDAKEIRIVRSSGHEILDQNAVEAVKKASPFPHPPIAAHLTIPIIYHLN